MGHITGVCRHQTSLFPARLDDVVGADHPVRVIDAFVDILDLTSLGFTNVTSAATGRPGYRPGDLLKLYIYGYLNQIRSSRRLEREAVRNVEVLWLIGQVSPSFKTIADFRKDHPSAIVRVCRAFVGFCRGQKLMGGTVVAVDGSKVEAVASRKSVITPKGLKKALDELDRKIAAYLHDLEEADRAEDAAPSPTPVAVGQVLEALRQRRAEVQAQAEALTEEELSQRVTSEPEARLMRTARHGHQVAYNAQIAVDAEHGLIAAFDLVNDCNDQRQLEPMAKQAQAELEAEHLTVLADAGYSNGEQATACAAAGITAAVPRPRTVNTTGSEFFSRDAFSYDPETDVWTCPAGAEMKHRDTCTTQRQKRYATDACASCGLKARCTKAARRIVTRSLDEEARSAMHRRTVDDSTLMKRRRELAEHPFGTMKGMMGTPRFLVRGLAKAKAELALVVLSFNLKRSLTILGVEALLAALQPRTA